MKNKKYQQGAVQKDDSNTTVFSPLDYTQDEGKPTMKKTKYKQWGVPQTLHINGIPEAGIGGFFKKVGKAIGSVVKGVGNVAHDWGLSVADSFGNRLGLYDIDNDKYRTGFGRSVSGINDILQNTTGKIGMAAASTVIPGIGSLGQLGSLFGYGADKGGEETQVDPTTQNILNNPQMMLLGKELSGLFDLQMREQDDVANKKMTVQDFPASNATYVPVGFAQDGGGITSMQGMFPALDSLKLGLPKEMPKKARKLVVEAAAKEVGHLEQMLGYRDDSPFKNKPIININSDTITMDGVGKTLLATSDNGIIKILKPYSGTHYFPGASRITEVPLPKGGGMPTPNNNSEIIKLIGMNKYQIMPNLQMIMQQGGFTRLKSDAGDPYQYEYDPQNDDYYVITPQGKTIKVKKGSKSDAAIRKRYQSGWSVVTKDKYKDTPYYDSVIDPKREKYLIPKDTPSDSTDIYSGYYEINEGVDRNGFYRKSDADGGIRPLSPEESKKVKAKFRDRYGYNSIDPINGYVGIEDINDPFKYNPVTGDIIEEVEEWDDTLGKPVKVRKKVRGDAYNIMREIVRKKGVATGLVPAQDEYSKRDDNFFGRLYNKWLFQDGGQPNLGGIISNITGLDQGYTDVVSDDKDPYEYRYDAATDTWETRLKGKGKKWIKVKGDSKRMLEADKAIRDRYDKQLFSAGSKAAEFFANGTNAPQISVQLLPTKVSPYVQSINDDSNGFRDSKVVNRKVKNPTPKLSNYNYEDILNSQIGYEDEDIQMMPSMIRYKSDLYKKDKLIDELLNKLYSNYIPTSQGLTVFNPLQYNRKYENGGKVMQNYMPVGNQDKKITGYIPLEAMIPIQTERDELIVLPTGDLTKVNAKKRHSQMSDDEVTDIVPENSYILSQHGKVDIYKSEADQIQMEVENKPYNMWGTNPTPKVKTLGDIMSKKVMKPADLARLLEQKYKIINHDDPFTTQTNAINKHRRGNYLQAIIQLSEYDKARKGIDNSIETQLAQNNQQPPQMVASNGGKVMKAGYNVPKAQDPLTGAIIGGVTSLISTGVSAYQNWKARQRADKLMNQQLGDINTYNNDVRRNLGLGLGVGAATTLLQDPTINPVIESDQFISQLPSYVNASNNAIFQNNRSSLYANRPDTSAMTPQMAMLFGERYNSQTMQAQGQLAAQLAAQRANTFAQYLQARQNIFNKNAASRTAATNATRANQNNMMTTLGGMGMGYFDNLNNLSANVLNAKAAARGQNTATQIQLGNQMAQTINNGLTSGLQAYNSYMAAQQQQQAFDQWNYQRQFPYTTPQLPPSAGSSSPIYPQNNPSDCILGRNIRTGLPC